MDALQFILIPFTQALKSDLLNVRHEVVKFA